MPTLQQMHLDGPELHEKITQQLYRIDKNMKAMGFGGMAPEELREAYVKVKTAVVQIMSQPRASGAAPSPLGADQGTLPGLPRRPNALGSV